MLGTRTAFAGLTILLLAAAAALLLLSTAAVEKAIDDDRRALTAALDNALASQTAPFELADALAPSFALQYGFVKNQVDATQTIYGQYHEPSHWLAPLLALHRPSLLVEKRWQEHDIRLQLNGDHYLEGTASRLALPLILIGGTYLFMILLLLWRRGRTARQLATVRSGIERLPTLELPSQVQELSGALRPLGETLQSTRTELKARLAKFSTSKLQANPVLDEVTGIKSRAFFVDEMERPQNTDSKQGHLILLRANALEELNRRQGRSGGDQYLAEIAHVLKQYARKEPSGYAYRYGAVDFILRLPDCERSNAITLLKDLSMQLAEVAKHQEVENAGSVGAIAYRPEDRVSQLLINLDTAVSMADSQGAHGHYLMDASLAELGLDSERWLTVIDDVLDHRRLNFIHQRIRPTQDGGRLYTEMLVRFENADGNPLPTEPLFSMAARYGRAIELDKLIFTRLIRELLNDSSESESFGLNLASHSFNDVKFMRWLEHQLQDQPGLASRLVFEVSERSIQQNPNHAGQTIERLHKLGARICIDHFGTALTSFRYLQMLKPDYVKLESGLTRNIDKTPNNQFFIKMLLDIAVRLDIKVIAAQVEQPEEKITLEELKVHGLQGHHIAMPRPLHQMQA
ncbi:EAL domain-containing protein [Ferrimonas balearica]|uniref:EAL domain-containing protein n=1 Tax=Ferrimonas balearica TaxID=44012 RepID=UPI001C990678|nr:EAL domain-containing protein [Ferrimonas balearica]MBY5991913.1 EAL domain-containing protein [Ferrimonas balearica]